jgi:hypothetical protein
MKQINKDEVFSSFKEFLKGKGIELQEGVYAHRIRQGCDLLADSVNLSQRALKRTKSAVEGGLEHLRQVIHEQTAPKSPPKQSGTQSAPKAEAAREKGRKKSKPAAKAAKSASRGRKK